MDIINNLSWVMLVLKYDNFLKQVKNLPNNETFGVGKQNFEINQNDTCLFQWPGLHTFLWRN